MSKVAPYGSWVSTITPDLFAKGNCKGIAELQATDDGVFWVEQSASTGKRELYFESAKSASEGRVRWAPEQSVQNSVHEYGGGSFIPLKDGSIVYTTVEGVYHQKRPDAAPRQLADANEKKLRFADFTATDTHIYCVNESHLRPNVDPENRLISINKETKEQKVVASGADFYASPRVSSDGKRLVWMQWNHVNMPWDETSIHMAVLHSDGTVSDEVVIKDGTGKKINYYCPNWVDDKLLMINDSTNFWNVYEVSLVGPEYKETNLFPVDREIGYPLWQFADRPYASNGKCMGSDLVKIVIKPKVQILGPRKASCIVKIDIFKEDQKPTINVIRTARDDKDLESLDISEPEDIEFQSGDVTVHAWLYMPKNRNYVAPEGTLPPVLLVGHGGPTGISTDALDLKKQFFTSRGFAVLDVNYRGSTGCGTEFRNMLKGQWGLVDRDDMIAAAQSVIAKGLVDTEKVCIKGSSAGGYLVLSSLLHSDVFKAAVSIYGVGDLVGLAKDTHKFERGYNEVLIGKYPEDKEVYEARSPINHIDRLRTPIAFLHGKEDTVVPVSQSVEMYDKLREKGVTTALMLFDDEGHGFRGADAVRRSSEASYVFLCKVLGIEPSISSDIEIVNLQA
ncbi:unnamed protein product [Cylicocyclus nassatus]|uniref:Peptidase S9 prolyl oligopeptidase catalytic domain-containing protein n=1 Tax=Cylicocyclus nassatus TaxID=53992 RepID=A0AA36M6W0_CYLNA|nr:unnamed protein product [Cylicocyclus nassatus]